MGAAWRKHCRASSLAAASEFFKLVQKDMQVLISAPAAVVPQWHEECCRILEAGWETWLQALSCDTREPLPTVDLIILDEAHHLKNSATKNEPRLARHYGVKLALTGSPKDFVSETLVALAEILAAAAEDLPREGSPSFPVLKFQLQELSEYLGEVTRPPHRR
ncbi:hypothetical protein AK812_SmicGene38567 [Symbiodinium microadriaticum]|uniref:Helicase ATP-binding domain-containing protein n=1 Tax=Symbiodinium microadriaticum TaxID=2951 RepID=A0A1Q9CDE8_SYMMI|nr:hypothetical protein AK812_SmicGene38567 [Symbiodinium microadriaticum]